MSQILIDEISSIGESFFSMKFKNKIVKEGILSSLCKLKDGKYTYHIDEKNLMKLNDYHIDFFPYKWINGYSQYSHLTKNQYIDLMKYTFFWYLEKGEMGKLFGSLSECQEINEIIWDSTSLKKPKKPNYIQIPLNNVH